MKLGEGDEKLGMRRDQEAGRDQRKEVGLDIQRCDRRGDRDELFNDTGAGIRDLESRD